MEVLPPAFSIDLGREAEDPPADGGKVKRPIRILLCGVIACVLALSGCSTTPSVVAVVNGVDITGDQYERALNGFLSSYGLTEETMMTTLGLPEAVDYKNGVIDEMVLQELMLQYAAANGLDELSVEDADEIDGKVDSYLDGLRSSFTADVETEGTLTGDAAAHEAEQRYEDYIDTYGYTEDNLHEQFRRQLILDRVYDSVMAECMISEEEVLEYYNQQLAEQMKAEQTDPDALYEQYISRVEGTDVPVYIPERAHEEVRYVKHILVQLPSDVSAEISEKEASGDTEAAEELRTEAMSELRDKAASILAEAKAGADFDTLVARYNEDPGVAYNPDGYMVYEGAPFDSAFLEDALSLERIGDISDSPVESGYGYHILKFVSVPRAGAVPFGEVKQEIEGDLSETKRKAYWESAVESWEQEALIEKHQFRAE